MNIKQLMELVEKMFSDRLSFMILNQEIADNFYPQRASFTVRKKYETEYANDLMTSYPILTRRDLGDQIGQMLRPTATEWFRVIPKGGEKTNNEGNRWLQMATERMRAAMYAQPAQFNRATKQADHDYASFGNVVLSCRPNRNVDNLLYRSFHLRDCVWHENDEGQIDLVARRMKKSAYDLKTLFRGNVGQKVEDMIRRNKHFEEVECYHIEVMADMYDGFNLGRPWFSVYYIPAHQHILQEVPVWMSEYIIARWQTVSGSQYAFSPASITALPDARLLQSMTYTILEAGEKATNPPLVATQDVVRSDVAIYAGGITWVDKDYDERLGNALRPMTQDIRGLPFGQDMILDSRSMLMQAFYLNKLTLPERAPEMTAYEVGQRVQEYIRGALPIFEPMESEYNGGLCMATFERLLRLGALGPPSEIPAQLQQDGVDFEYQSPLHDAIEEQKGQKFLETKAMIAEALDLDRGAAYVMDARVALRDALTAVGVPATWMHDEDEVERMVNDAAEQEQQQLQLDQAVQNSEIAKNTAAAGQDLQIY